MKMIQRKTPPRREGKPSIRDIAVVRIGGMGEGGLTPEEINGEVDFTSSDAMVDQTRYRGVKLAPGYQDTNNPADYKKC